MRFSLTNIHIPLKTQQTTHWQRGQVVKDSVITETSITRSCVKLVGIVASLNKTPYDAYLLLVELKQAANIGQEQQPENLEPGKLLSGCRFVERIAH